MRQQNWLFSKWRTVAEMYGFEEYDAACIDSEEIFRRKKIANNDAALAGEAHTPDSGHSGSSCPFVQAIGRAGCRGACIQNYIYYSL